MKVRFAEATGCPFGQFIIEAENDNDRTLMKVFLAAPRKEWQFHLHGYSLVCMQGFDNFNFGWVDRRKWGWRGRVQRVWSHLIRMARMRRFRRWLASAISPDNDV